MNHDDDCMIWEHQPAGEDGWHECDCHVFYSNGSSAHDPICPQATIYSGEWEPDQRHWSCHCDIIAKVRADERKKAGARVADITYWEDGWPENVVVSRISAIYAAEGEENE